MAGVTVGISPECLCHDVRDKPVEPIIERFEAFIETGCNHILWADMSSDHGLVAKVGADQVLPYLKKRYGSKVPQPA